MQNKLVTVIVPIYNVDKFIKRCVTSIIQQDYRNIEIILIDDGSTDNCPDIIDNLAKEDERIIAIHKKNGGVSSARNVGLKHANGEYVIFIDGDDWVEKDYVSYFLNMVLQYNCEIGMNKNNYSSENRKSCKSCDCNTIIKSEKVIEWIYLGDIFVAVWNKIYKMDFLRKNNISFNNEIWYGEGMLFNIECLQFVDKVAIGEKCVYHQVSNPNSAMRNFNLKSNLCGIKSLDIQKSLWKKSNESIENAWRYHKYNFNRSIIEGLVRSDGISDNKYIYKTCVQNLRKDIHIAFKVERTIKKKIYWICYYICPFLMAIRAAKKYYKSLLFL